MNKVAFITGASRGIGRETALAFARAGFDVAISARTLAEGETHQHALTHADGRPLADLRRRVDHRHRMDARRNLRAFVHHDRKPGHGQPPARRKDCGLQAQTLPVGTGPKHRGLRPALR